LTNLNTVRRRRHSVGNQSNLQGVNMDDLYYLCLTVAFFASSAALVYALEKLRGPQ
jgi:hypothetical protein